jgi:patatin-like phospholipase/acyl hydrolase
MNFKILAIDGGGIKGLYSSTILEHLEKVYECSCSDHFDMLCGTSTGGLIALGLAQKIPAKEISKIYTVNGAKIFPKHNKYAGLFRQAFWRGKYTDDALKRALTEIFGDKQIKESNNLLCIPSYSITDARPWIFKYDHKEGALSRDNEATFVDVALATSAAPTFFPMAELPQYDYKQFIDGGVWANNPALCGLVEALTYFVGENKQYKGIEILSVASLNNTAGKPTGLKRNRSFLQWGNDLFEPSLIAQSAFTDYFLSKLNNITGIPIIYTRIPSEQISAEQQHLVQLDVATPDAIHLIRGKGNDRGLIAEKDPAIAQFFKTKKTYSTRYHG